MITSFQGQLPDVLVESSSVKMVEAWELLPSSVDYIWYHAGKQGIGRVGHVPGRSVYLVVMIS